MDSAERAARAVREFRHMVPGLTSYARTITGNPNIRVRPHPQTSTDGHNWVNNRPPLVLPDPADHDRRLCDHRDEIGTLLCVACARSEAIYACLYHEMSHIVSGSLDTHGEYQLRKAIKRGVAGAPESLQKYVEKNISKVDDSMSIYEAAQHLHPYLVSVLRGVDDYVIETKAIEARPGVEEMLYYMQEQIMLLGIELEDGSREPWSERPTETQLPIALLIELHGWGLEGKFSDEAIDVIRCDAIQTLTERSVPNVLTGLSAAIGFLGEFNRLGYLLAKDQEEQEQEDGQDSEDSEDSGSDRDDNPESDDDDDSSGDGNGDEQGSDSDGQSDDESDSGTGAGDDSGEPDEAGQDVPDDKSSELDGEPNIQHGDGRDKSDDDGNDSESGSGSGDLPDEFGDDRDSDDQENAGNDSGEQESDEVSGDDAQGDSESGDTDSGGDSDSGMDGDDSGSDSRGADPVDNRSGDPAPNSGSGDDDGSSDSGSGDGDSSDGRATPEEIERAMNQATGHEQNEKLMEEGYEASGTPTHSGDDDDGADGQDSGQATVGGTGAGEEDGDAQFPDVTDEDLEIAIIQAIHFDEISRTVGRVVIYKGEEGYAMRGSRRNWTPAPESVIAGTVNRARRVFSDNDLDKHVNNLKKGKLSARSLGARGWGDDRRVFRKKIRANKTDYEVVIGMDISGSTQNGAIHKIKRAGCAMADLLTRVGVDFSIYAHTTDSWLSDSMEQHMYELKSPTELWDKSARARLANITYEGGSLDGHNFEFYRKVLMRSQAQKRICVYYTDGYIPDTNHYDEADIMERESKLYRQMGFESLIVAVGIELDDPYGFDQVRLVDDSDISTVLAALEKKLTGGRKYV